LYIHTFFFFAFFILYLLLYVLSTVIMTTKLYYIRSGTELTWGRVVQGPTWRGADLVWRRSDCHPSHHNAVSVVSPSFHHTVSCSSRTDALLVFTLILP